MIYSWILALGTSSEHVWISWHYGLLLPSFGSPSKPHSYNLVAQGTFPNIAFFIPFHLTMFALRFLVSNLFPHDWVWPLANSIMSLSSLDSSWLSFPFHLCPGTGYWLYFLYIFFFSPLQVPTQHSPYLSKSREICYSCRKDNYGPCGTSKSASYTSIQNPV